MADREQRDLAASDLTRLQRLSHAVDSGISYAFRRWASFVSRKPYTVILFTTIFAAVWTVAFVAQFAQELDNDDLFTPKDAESFDDKEYVDSLYPSYSTRGRILSIRHEDHLAAEGCSGRVLLPDESTARENLQALFQVYELITQLEVEYDGEMYRFQDICIKNDNTGECLVTSILDIWNYNEAVIMDPDFAPLEAINEEKLEDRFGFPLDLKSVLGKPDPEDWCFPNDNRTSANVEAFAFTLIYEYEREEKNGEEYDPESQKFVEELADAVRDISKTMVLDNYIADENAVGSASQDEIESDISLLTVGYVLIILYTNVVLFKNSCHSCKMHLTFASVIGIGFALMSAFGIAQTFNVKFNMIIQILPFLILGLGIDDTFVIVGAYQRMPFDLSVEGKIAGTLERAGSSIFVTSATDFCAFLMGMYTRLPALRAFSTYAALAIFMDFAYQVTFFVAFLVIDARREARLRNGAPKYGVKLGWRVGPYDEAPVTKTPPAEQEMTASGINGGLSEPSKTSSTAFALPAENPDVWKKMCGQGYYDPTIPSFSTKLAGTYIPAVTLHPIGKFVFLAIEGILLAFAIYGCTKVKMNFNYIDMFTPDGSDLAKAFDLEDDYFLGDSVYFSVYTKEAEMGDYFYHQDELEALRIALENDEFVIPPVRTWYQGYIEWLQTDSPYADELVDNRPPDAASFNTWLQEYLAGAGAIYEANVIFTNGSNPHVISSQIDAITVDIIDGETSVDLLDSIRDSIKEAAPSLDPVPFTIAFLFYDGYRVIAWETVRNVMMAALGVFIMNVVVLASVPMALMVVGMVALTDVMLFGYMWYVDQYFNPVTAVNLVLAVGIAVDYSAHIAHSFLVVPGDRATRAKSALEHIGGEVLSGAFTTWLGIVLMGAAQHYIFQSFFKMFFAIVVAGAWHGIVILPIVLSFVGSAAYPSRKDTEMGV